jgi:signal transduction histidine kinase/CheY-like chemotaxis protein
MGRLLRDASIRTKVLALVMLVTMVALILASGSLLLWDYYQFKTDIGRELSTQAQMVLQNSTAAMSFEDRAAARETLETLSPNRHIRLGCLYNAAGALFVQFAPGGAGPCPESPPPVGSVIGPNRVQVVVRTDVAGRPAGSVYLESDLDAVSGRVRIQAVTAAMVLGVSLVVALLLSSVLQRIISEPIDALARTAREVSNRNDYSLRAHKATGDELGLLVDAFNGMLSQIELAEQERAGLLTREREANRLKDEFLMTLSHELRTPLNAILGWTRLLISRVIPPEGIDNALHKIERNVQAQTRLVEDLLEISRFTTGKFRLERLPVDLVVITNQAIEAIRPSAEARRITIERRFEASPAPTNGDPDRLQQVVWNLLSNAVKFSASDSRVVVTLRITGGVCELGVQDTGIGIDPVFLAHVFEPFRQADASSTRAHGGLGLGLSIVHRIVDLHGGEIKAESAGIGQGSTFTLRLPVTTPVESPLLQSAGSRWSDTGDLTGVKVLVVDDDADTRELLGAFLGTAGAQVSQASNVSQALQLAREILPDVLVSDIAMPDQDGYMLLKELRNKPGHPGPRVAIALTAQATHADRERALAAGFDRHVAKPFDPRLLIEVVREVIAASPR